MTTLTPTPINDYLTYIPKKNINFIPTSSFLQLSESLKHDNDLITPRILYSKDSGVGKTSIVINYCYYIQESPSNSSIYSPATNSSTSSSSSFNKYHFIRYMKMNSINIKIEWIKFASILNISIIGLTLQEIIRLIYSRISSDRYLLIFEDVESYQYIQSSLPLDIQSGQHIIITTTNDTLWPSEYSTNMIRVESFTIDETILYMNKFCKLNRLEVISSEENSIKLHDLLSGYPLAIVLSLHYIYQQSQGNTSRGILTIDNFIKLFKTKSLLEKYRHLPYGISKLIYPLCDLIIEAIKISSPTSSQILEQICLLSDTSILYDSFFYSLTTTSTSTTTTSSPKAAQTSVPFAFSSSTTSTSSNNILSVYHNYGLLQPFRSLTFSVHSLSQIVLCELILFLHFSGGNITKLSGFREDNFLEKSFLPLVKKFYLQILKEEEKTFDEDRNQCIHIAGDIHLQAKHLLIIFTYFEGNVVTPSSQIILKKIKIMITLILGSTLCRLGLYLDAFNQYQELTTLMNSSSSSFSSSSSSSSTTDQLSDPDIVIPFSFTLQKRLGMVLYHLTKYSEALPLFQSYYDFLQPLKTSCSSEYEQSFQLVANTFLAMRQYEEANRYYEQLLIYQRSIYPELHYKIAQSLHAIATIFIYQEIYTEALLLFRESIFIKKKVLPSNHSEIMKTLLEIGHIYQQQKKYSQALLQYEEIYNIIRQQSLPPSSSTSSSSSLPSNYPSLPPPPPSHHPMMTCILDHLGYIHQLENHFQESLDYYQQSYQIKKRIYSENHFEIAQIIHKIAEIYKEQGKHSLALDWFQQAYHMKLMLFPEIHEEIVKTTYCIGLVYTSQGKYIQALESFLNCLNTQRHLISSSSSTTTTTATATATSTSTSASNTTVSPLSPLVPISSTLSSSFSSSSSASSSYSSISHLQSQNHDLSETLRQIGNIYQNQGRYLQALSSYEESLQIQQQLYQQTNQRVHQIMIAQVMCQIGSVYKSQERYEDSLRIYQEALKIQQDLYGLIHNEIAITLSNIALIYISQGQYDQSLIYLNHSLSIKNDIHNTNTNNQSIIVTKETIRRTEKQKELKFKILKQLQEYLENRMKETEMVQVSSSYSLGMIYSKDEKISAVKFLINYIERTGLERLGELQNHPEYQQYEGPLTNGRLGQLTKNIYDEIYARENMLPMNNNEGNSGRLRGTTI